MSSKELNLTVTSVRTAPVGVHCIGKKGGNKMKKCQSNQSQHLQIVTENCQKKASVGLGTGMLTV